jgi:hypothetical protein
MSPKVGLNLDIEERHYTAGAAATKEQRARQRRLDNAELGKSVIIRPEHRLNGAKAANRAKALANDEEATHTRNLPFSLNPEPFKGIAEPMHDLLELFGYPTANQSPPKDIGVIHRMGLVDEDADPVKPSELRERSIAGKPENYRQANDGSVQKRCNACREWKPLTEDYYRHKTDRLTKSWAGDCHPCERERRRVAWKRRYQLQKLGLAK